MSKLSGGQWYAAGVAALVLSVDPSIDQFTVMDIVMESAVDLGPPGYDTEYGCGFVNARYAVEAALPGTWVDFDYTGTENGNFLTPFNTLAEGLDAVPAGGTIRIKAGVTSEGGYVNQDVRLESWKGIAMLGQ